MTKPSEQFTKDLKVLLDEDDLAIALFHDAEDVLSETGYETELRDLIKEHGFTAEVVDSYGGEGMGDEYWSVVRFTKNGESALVKFNGWYASYNGAEYEEWFFVEAREVMVTKYFEI